MPPMPGFASFSNPSMYRPAPSTWWVALTDVKGSTKAIQDGHYKAVNQLGVACIVGVLNAVEPLEVPYVFGGDGATLLIPPTRVDAVRSALQGLQRIARDSFQMELRAAMVPVDDLQREGHQILVAKLRSSEHVALAMLSGSGPSVADSWMKDPERAVRYAVPPPKSLPTVNTDGFECRWRPLQSVHGEVVSVLIKARGDGEHEQRATYDRVLKRLEELLGALEARSPVLPEALELSNDAADLRGEALIRRGPGKVGVALHRAWALLENNVGRMLMRQGWNAAGFDGANYATTVALQTDFRKFDDMLRAVLDMSADSHQKLRSYLEQERQSGALIYGTHSAGAALITCAVFDRQDRHVHFVDGAKGGYALAAKELKAQLLDPTQTPPPTL